MGLLNLFNKSSPSLLRLPAGSFTVDRSGALLAGTLPSNFPSDLAREIARNILTSFREAAAAHLPLTELVIHYPSLKISARELRGGAVIFLTPKTTDSPIN